MVILSFGSTLSPYFIALCTRCRTFETALDSVSMSFSRHIFRLWMDLLPSARKTLRPD